MGTEMGRVVHFLKRASYKWVAHNLPEHRIGWMMESGSEGINGEYSAQFLLKISKNFKYKSIIL